MAVREFKHGDPVCVNGGTYRGKNATFLNRTPKRMHLRFSTGVCAYIEPRHVVRINHRSSEDESHTNRSPPRVSRVTRSPGDVRVSEIEDPVPPLIPSSPALLRSRVNPRPSSSPPNHTLRRVSGGRGMANSSSPRGNRRHGSSINFVDDSVVTGTSTVRPGSSPRFSSFDRSPYGSRTSAHAGVWSTERDVVHNRMIQDELSNLRAGLDRLSLLTEAMAVRSERSEHNRH